MQQGLPTCPCGAGELRPEALADLAFIGEITIADVGQPTWNAICRENGWEITRNAGQSKRVGYQSIVKDRVAPAEQCAYVGCGRWVKHGETHCSQHTEVREVAMAF